MKASLPLRVHIWFQRTILLKTSYGMKDSAIILDLPKSKAYNTFKNQLWDESICNLLFLLYVIVQYF